MIKLEIEGKTFLEYVHRITVLNETHPSQDIHVVYTLGTKHGFPQSMDCAMQSMDPHFV